MNFLGDSPDWFRSIVSHKRGAKFEKFALDPRVPSGVATMTSDGTVAFSRDESFTALLCEFLLFSYGENTYLRKSGSGVGGGGGGGVIHKSHVLRCRRRHCFPKVDDVFVCLLDGVLNVLLFFAVFDLKR